MFKLLTELEKIVNNNKERVAYKVAEEVITYQKLWNKAYKLSISLRAEGISPVILYGHKSVNMLVSILACLIANRTYIPVDIYTPIDRIEKIVKLSNSSLMICNESLKIDSVKCLTIEEIKEQYFEKKYADTSYNEIAYIIFTSGSTGEPKGVPISYDNLENFISWIKKVIPKQNGKIQNVLNQASFSFDLSVADIYYSLFQGCALVALERSMQNDYNKMFGIIKKNEINLMVVTPTFIKLFLLDNDFNYKNFPNLRCVYFCGEILEVSTVKKLLERFPSINIINAYGPTEATSAVSSIVINEEMLFLDYLPVGKVDEAAVEIKIIDDEIVLKGKSVFGGYCNVESEKCYTEDGINCYQTGDRGRIEEGLLYCLGRKDDQIKYMGYRIELGDIENNLLKIDGVREAVVVPSYKDDTSVIKGIKAFVVLDDETMTVENIKNKLYSLLPNYMIPKIIKILDKIPINQNGKYDRKKLKEL